MKTKLSILIAFVMTIAMLCGCGGDTQIKNDQAAVTIGKIIARRLGVAAAQKYPILASQVSPIAQAIIDSAANGDDLITILKKGLAEIPDLDPLIKRDMQDLIDLLEVHHNVRIISQEIAGAFLEGVSIYSTYKVYS